jgi:rhodanese-related sulfurtransferase
VAELQPDRQAPILCYCRGGNRGALAADELQRLGYSNVASIEGGLTAFLAEPD